jgi:uncharacterized protein
VWAEVASMLYAVPYLGSAPNRGWCHGCADRITMVETVAVHEIEPEITALLADLKRRLERRFGDRFVALYLFGSRARGDHEPDSDVDVAVILDQKMPRPFDLTREILEPFDLTREILEPFDLTREILEETYDLLLETGYYIQPWPLEKGSLDDPLAHPDATISRAVRREGVSIA